MEQTRFYIYDKISGQESVVGQYQLPFNMGLGLDESKDSCKVVILSNRKDYIEPYTICRLEGFSNLWWVVKKDSVVRHDNDFNFLYEHRLNLEGAIELLNARDLTSCGFNTNRYTIAEFVARLFALSDFEYSCSTNFNNVLSQDEKVDYIKTFENYTLASALKEFFNGYNCIPKLSFNVSSGHIQNAYLTIYSKKGLNENSIDISHFNDVNETSNIDSESFATRVISNVQNCISKNVVRYPAKGCFGLRKDTGYIVYDDNGENATLVLPSNVYYMKSITIYGALSVTCTSSLFGGGFPMFYVQPNDMANGGINFRNTIVNSLRAEGIATDEQIDIFISLWETAFREMLEESCKTIENGGYHDAISNEDIGSYAIIHNNLHTDDDKQIKLFLNNERYSYVNDKLYHRIITWKQGSNIISGFDFFSYAQKDSYGIHSTTHFNNNNNVHNYTFNLDGTNLTVSFGNALLTLLDNKHNSNDINVYRTMFSVEYIPMGDLKLKADNNKLFNDSKLYNQNGKLVDSYAISKLINGYSESISGGEITKSKKYYSYNDIPTIGKIVNDSGTNFVISNVSIDVYDNENGFVYDCDFTLNVYSSCKSTMISANTSIRDYDCPQENNIKRVQLYRDYVEYSYEKDENASERFIDYEYINVINSINLGFNDNFFVYLKATDTSFHNLDSGDNSYYYILKPTTFALAKKKVINVDFIDNNIIGYSSANAYNPISFSSLLNPTKLVCVPISYVDSIGELDQIELIFENIDLSIIKNYNDECVIKKDIYVDAYDKKSLIINEQNYKKDGLEVPVFLYSLEVNGDNGIEIANDILEYDTDFDAFVCVVEENITITNENQKQVFDDADSVIQCNIVTVESTRVLKVSLVDASDNLKGKSIGVWAMKNGVARFVMAFNNYPNDEEEIICYRNFYKLK